MIDINTTEILAKEQKISRDPVINFSGNGKSENAKFSGKFTVTASREETLIPMSFAAKPS